MSITNPRSVDRVTLLTLLKNLKNTLLAFQTESLSLTEQEFPQRVTKMNFSFRD